MLIAERFKPYCIRNVVLATLTLAGLDACVSAPPPVILAAPPSVVIYQPSPVRPPMRPQPATPGMVAPSQKLTDGAILGILAAANNAEIREAQLALHNSQNPDVRRFARHMIREHSNMNIRLLRLAGHLNLAPLTSAASNHLTTTAKQALVTLSGRHGHAFDQLYINHQVSTHRTVVNGINSFLLPDARYLELKIALRQIRSIMLRHLQSATQLQSGMR
jgi:putative membrane protein